ncbi:hypothetical protein M422DRAFT_243926 [Sphaerobolus stellatus SS14]|nr:hypothetical protein M422DRAFT_243926 [Sphaerobolus stellatus SS14]
MTKATDLDNDRMLVMIAESCPALKEIELALDAHGMNAPPPEWVTKDDSDITELPLFVVTEHDYTAYGYALNFSDCVFS